MKEEKEQLCANEWDNLHKMGKFLETKLGRIRESE